MSTKATDTHALLKARLAAATARAPQSAPSAMAPIAPVPAPFAVAPPPPPAESQVDQALEELPPDERKSHRRKTCIGGVIQLNDGSQGIFCSVRDMSATGALLSLNGGGRYDFAARQRDVPSRFWLYIKQDRMQVPCEVIRRVGQVEIGVRFLAAPRFA